jgi:hypothetical protein
MIFGMVGLIKALLLLNREILDRERNDAFIMDGRQFVCFWDVEPEDLFNDNSVLRMRVVFRFKN